MSMGGKGIAYQKHLVGEFERDDWNTVEIIARGDTTTHVLNGQVVNRGRNIRLVDPANPSALRVRHSRPDLARDRGGGLYFRKVELRSLDGAPVRDK